MERALLLTAGGGLTLYLFYLLSNGDGPKPVPADTTAGVASMNVVSSTHTAPIRDPTTLAEVVRGDTTIQSRPGTLGGVSSSTGDRQPEPTHTSVQQREAPGGSTHGMCNKTTGVPEQPWDIRFCQGLTREQCAVVQDAYMHDKQPC